jgi:hypothetical protein
MPFAEIIDSMLPYIIFLTGLSLLISRIIKWFSKDKRWDSKAITTACGYFGLFSLF